MRVKLSLFLAPTRIVAPEPQESAANGRRPQAKQAIMPQFIRGEEAKTQWREDNDPRGDHVAMVLPADDQTLLCQCEWMLSAPLAVLCRTRPNILVRGGAPGCAGRQNPVSSDTVVGSPKEHLVCK